MKLTIKLLKWTGSTTKTFPDELKIWSAVGEKEAQAVPTEYMMHPKKE